MKTYLKISILSLFSTLCAVFYCIWLTKGACENYINLTIVYF